MFKNIEAYKLYKPETLPIRYLMQQRRSENDDSDIGCDQDWAFIGTGSGFSNGMLDLKRFFDFGRRLCDQPMRILNLFERKLIDYWILLGFIEY
jgi:hypothetical protein